MLTLTIGDCLVVTAGFSEHGGGRPGARIVSTHPARLFTRDQAITMLTVADVGEGRYPDGRPLVVALQEELR